MISAAGHAEESIFARIGCAAQRNLGNFCLYLPQMCSLCTKGNIFQEFVRSIVLYGSEIAGVKHVSGVLFSVVVRLQVSSMCQECCSQW